MKDYVCSVCGAECFVESGVVRRTCGHDDAAVIADRTCTLYGAGGADNQGLFFRAVSALQSIARAFKGA